VIVRWNHWCITGASREPKVSERYFRSKAKAKVAGCAHSRRSSLAVRLLFGWIVLDRLVLGRNSTFFDVCSLHRAQNERAQLKKQKNYIIKNEKRSKLLDKLIHRLEGKSEIAYYEIALIIFCACLPELYYLFFYFRESTFANLSS